MIDESIHNELRAQYNPDGSELRKKQLHMLRILKIVDEICRKNRLSYWIEGGTALGAVRHGGFIPWDDDVDIAMLETDYRKLMSILPQQLPEGMYLQNDQTDNAYLLKFAKIRNEQYSIKETSDYDLDYMYKGLYIDIFPMKKGSLFLGKISSKIVYLCREWVRKTKKRNSRHIKYKISHLIINSTCSIFNIIGCLFNRELTYAYGTYFGSKYDMDVIFPLSEVEFEGERFYAPGNINKYLTDTFGDYLKLPKKEDRKTHLL